LVQQWIPPADRRVLSAVAQALGRSFAEVRVFPSVWKWGYHFMASRRPTDRRTAAQLAARLPAPAARDMLEWGPAQSTEAQFDMMLAGEMPLRQFIDPAPGAPVLTDDRPVNEYYFLRQLREGDLGNGFDAPERR
jgi:hypothetical protein